MTILDRTQAPEFQSIQNFKLVKADSFQLDNGIPVHVVNAGKQPVLNLQIIFKAGKWYEPQAGVASMMAKMLAEGTKTKTASQINQAFDQLGAFKEIYAGFDLLNIDAYCLSKFLQPVVEVIQSFITEATFPEVELENVKRITLQQLKVNLEKNSYQATTHFREKLFGLDHPYGYSLTPEILAHIDRDSLANYYNKKIQSQPFDIVLSGEVTKEHIKILNQSLGQLPIQKSEERSKEALDFTPQSGRFEFRKEDALQTSIRLGGKAFPFAHEDQISYEVFNEVFGGYFGSRLMKNIREDKGFTYGIYSSLAHPFGTGYFSISADVNKEKSDEAIVEIYKEIEQMKTEEVGQEELQLVKNYIAGNYIKSINTPISIADYFKTMYFNNLPQDYYDHYISSIEAVTSQQVMEMTNKYFSGKLIEILVG